MRKIAVPLFVLLTLFGLTGFWGPYKTFSTGSSVGKKIALTFDDGPSAYTLSILKILKKNKTPATFFVLGENATQYRSTLKEIVREGNEVENHSWSHFHLVFHNANLIRNEINQTNTEIKKITGQTPQYFRPPYGQYHLGILKIAYDLHMKVVLWSITAYDWLRPGSDRISSNVIKQLSPGSIILLHDGGGDRTQTVDALQKIIEMSKKQGYYFVLLKDLLNG